MSSCRGFQFGLRAIFVLTAVVALLSWSAVTFPVALAVAAFWLVWCVFAGTFVAVSIIVIEAVLGVVARALQLRPGPTVLEKTTRMPTQPVSPAHSGQADSPDNNSEVNSPR